MLGEKSVALQPITDADAPAVARFLHANLNRRVSAAAWEAVMAPPWPASQPNHGFMLLDNGRVVGAYLALYSDRSVDGGTERFCNLAAWCVLESHRAHGLRLLRALLRQKEYHFTDFSPSGNVVALNTRLGFELLDRRTALIANIPWPGRGRRAQVITSDATIRTTLGGRDLRLYQDHASTAAHQLVLEREGRSCLVVFRRDRLKRLPLFASVIHVTDPGLFLSEIRRFGRYVLLRHGMVGTMAELRLIGKRPRLSTIIEGPRPRMYKSRTLRPDQIDYLYSELACLAW